jgi:hypothetical protein
LATLTEAQAIVRFRKEINDNIDTASTNPPPSHAAIDEPMVGPINAANTVFRVRHMLMLPLGAPVVTVKDQAHAVLAVTSVDGILGLVTMTAAPASPAVLGLFATYRYAFFTDAQLQVFLQAGYEFVSADAITSIVEGLYPAMFAFAKAQAYEMIADNSGDFFDFTVGGETASKGEVTDRWQQKANDARKLASDLRKGFYTTNDRRERPAMAISVPDNQPPWTPTR